MDRYLLGKEIKRRRVELRLTQKQLAIGICKQSIISKIENGEFFPSFELLVALTNRLKISINYLFESAISDQYFYIDNIKKEIFTLISDNNYQKVYAIAEKELKNNDFIFGEHKEFFIWAKAIAAYNIKLITSSECISILEKCSLENRNYVYQHQRILNRNSIAILYSKNGNPDKAFEEFEKLLLEFKKEDKNNFYLHVLFNYANNLHNYKRYDKALFIVNEAIVACKKVESIKMFGHFYFLKGECLKDLNYPKVDISSCFEKALFYFDLLQKDDYIKILWDTYYEYL